MKDHLSLMVLIRPAPSWDSLSSHASSPPALPLLLLAAVRLPAVLESEIQMERPGNKNCGVEFGNRCNPILGTDFYTCSCSAGWISSPYLPYENCALPNDPCTGYIGDQDDSGTRPQLTVGKECLNGGTCVSSPDLTKAVCVCPTTPWGKQTHTGGSSGDRWQTQSSRSIDALTPLRVFGALTQSSPLRRKWKCDRVILITRVGSNALSLTPPPSAYPSLSPALLLLLLRLQPDGLDAGAGVEICVSTWPITAGKRCVCRRQLPLLQGE
ncbi:unnamed protein product [Schistocephalus solidus]|uniref:EGF-like domain-containing protein n=1 Tax=Schistocephalus solidus TaxID=70667 RepID=A0A183SVG6_SCHSO|nr:unnamed protein product [Schistocephalus solidus]